MPLAHSCCSQSNAQTPYLSPFSVPHEAITWIQGRQTRQSPGSKGWCWPSKPQDCYSQDKTQPWRWWGHEALPLSCQRARHELAIPLAGWADVSLTLAENLPRPIFNCYLLVFSGSSRFYFYLSGFIHFLSGKSHKFPSSSLSPDSMYFRSTRKHQKLGCLSDQICDCCFGTGTEGRHK